MESEGREREREAGECVCASERRGEGHQKD